MPQQRKNLYLKRKKIKMKDKSNIVLYCFGGIVIVWLALLIAPYLSGGIFEIIEKILSVNPSKVCNIKLPSNKPTKATHKTLGKNVKVCS